MKHPKPTRLQYRRWRYVWSRKDAYKQAQVVQLMHRRWSGGCTAYGQVRDMMLGRIGWF